MVLFINEQESTPFNFLEKFSCLECRAEIWQMTDYDRKFIVNVAIIKGCEHFPVKVKGGMYLKQSSDKKPEKIGDIRI